MRDCWLLPGDRICCCLSLNWFGPSAPLLPLPRQSLLCVHGIYRFRNERLPYAVRNKRYVRWYPRYRATPASASGLSRKEAVCTKVSVSCFGAGSETNDAFRYLRNFGTAGFRQGRPGNKKAEIALRLFIGYGITRDWPGTEMRRKRPYHWRSHCLW